MNKTPLGLTILCCATLSTATLARPDGPPKVEGQMRTNAYKFAHNHYERGLEMLERGNSSVAHAAFWEAVTTLWNHNLPAKPEYLIKACETLAADIGWVYDHNRDAELEKCNDAVDLTNSSEAIAAREKLAGAFVARAIKKGTEAAEQGDHARAIPQFEYAAKHAPTKENYALLCTSQLAISSDAPACASAGITTEKLPELTAAQKDLLAAVTRVIPDIQADLDAERFGKCRDAVAAAEKGGARPGHRLEVRYTMPGAIEVANPGRMPNYYGQLRDVLPYCQAVLNRSQAEKLARGISNVPRLNKEMDEALEPLDLAGVEVYLPGCAKSVAEALAAGLEGSVMINYEERQIAADKIGAEVCGAAERKLAAKSIEVAARVAAIAEAKFAPYKKVLKDDKWRIYHEYSDVWLEGKGGVRLKTPEDHLKAKKWFLSSVGHDNAGRKTWGLTIFVFRGHKLVKQTRTSGYGPEAPLKAYR